jgi:glycosyltransferase involved in cell wall biosynthesis
VSIARYYRGARTTHLERLNYLADGDFLYYKPMYDFDEVLAQSLPNVARVRFLDVLWRVVTARYDVLEVAEPYTPSALPQNLAIAVATVVTSLTRRKSTRLVTYAIENSDLSAKLAVKTRLPRPALRLLIRTLVGFCYGRFDRIVFGTSDALDNYRALLGDRKLQQKRPAHTLIWGLPQAERELPSAAPEQELIFLGALDSRKGVRNLMSVWDSVLLTLPDAQLTIVGKGPFQKEVEQWASTRASVSVIIDPPRQVIRSILARSKALFLLSQPSPLWKEQIGLPILEGLSWGLEIIASTETGIACWLLDNGHAVVAPEAPSDEICSAILNALRSTRTRQAIVAPLPPVNGRYQADTWLFSPHSADNN